MQRASDGVEVRPVRGKAELARFLEVPFAIYAQDPAWVPPLLLERREHLSPRKNPYFQHAEAELFVAYRGGRPVGRVSAQVDRLRLERYADETGQFGFIEGADEESIFRALIDAAAAWLKARGMRRMQGPFDFSINEQTGLLVSGFETPPRIMMGHAPAYYGKRLEEQRLCKIKDVIAYDYDATNPLPRAMAAMVERAKASGELEIRGLEKKRLARDLDIIMSIFNDAWSRNWGFVPWTEQEIRALGQNLRLLVKEDYVAIAFWRGAPAAMAVSLPDLNLAIGDLKGRLLPLGWAKLAWRVLARPPGAVRMPLMGVLKEHQGSPVGAALSLAVIDRVRAAHAARGVKRAELSWILEDNLAMRRMIEALGGVPYKTYRIYERDL